MGDLVENTWARGTGMKTTIRRSKSAIGMSLSLLLLTGTAARSDNAVERIIFVRHGESAHNGLGQLSCQGLNRALALPSVTAKTFGRPHAIFAPDPDEQINSPEEPFDYVRALATIEPTAISFGLPVKVSIGASDTHGLRATLEQPQYKNALVLIAWEHRKIEAVARELLAAHGGDPDVVPKWHRREFDGIYVATITSIGDTKRAAFALMHQGLDGQKETCPQ
jgi:hypothetical protein